MQRLVPKSNSNARTQVERWSYIRLGRIKDRNYSSFFFLGGGEGGNGWNEAAR